MPLASLCIPKEKAAQCQDTGAFWHCLLQINLLTLASLEDILNFKLLLVDIWHIRKTQGMGIAVMCDHGCTCIVCSGGWSSWFITLNTTALSCTHLVLAICHWRSIVCICNWHLCFVIDGQIVRCVCVYPSSRLRIIPILIQCRRPGAKKTQCSVVMRAGIAFYLITVCGLGRHITV